MSLNYISIVPTIYLQERSCLGRKPLYASRAEIFKQGGAIHAEEKMLGNNFSQKGHSIFQPTELRAISPENECHRLLEARLLVPNAPNFL